MYNQIGANLIASRTSRLTDRVLLPTTPMRRRTRAVESLPSMKQINIDGATPIAPKVSD